MKLLLLIAVAFYFVGCQAQLDDSWPEESGPPSYKRGHLRQKPHGARSLIGRQSRGVIETIYNKVKEVIGYIVRALDKIKDGVGQFGQTVISGLINGCIDIFKQFITDMDDYRKYHSRRNNNQVITDGPQGSELR